jgi:dTDP-4-amino-4,6-dideoxygalactose transaminase
MAQFTPANAPVAWVTSAASVSHELEAYASLGFRAGAFPIAENWARQCLSLPIYPELTAAQVDFCLASLIAALQGEGVR